ncbi:MAG: hypothetical protein M1524_02520 [Patescibacteria group bacterium]|nr:hypothetical protein [Patescibacteria group bacterium]
MRIIKRKNLAVLKSILSFVYFFLLFISVVLVFAYWKFYLDKNRLVSPVPGSFAVKNASRVVVKNQEEELKEMLNKYKIEFLRLSVSTGSAYLVDLGDGSKAIISQKKPMVSQVSSLQLILSRFTIEGKRLSLVDFRFDKPLIVLK